MSNPDSFIDEVTEEVRRDRLFAAFRRYGWIGVLAILVIVGGAGWREYTKARDEARARAFGDAIYEAQDITDAADRSAALAALPTNGGEGAIRDLLIGTNVTDDRAGALAALGHLAGDETQPQIYRDLAAYKRVLLAGTDLSVADRRAALEPLAQPGRPLRTLASEQLAVLLVEEGHVDDAIAAFNTLSQDQEAPLGLRGRVRQMVLALGGTPVAPTSTTGGAATAAPAVQE